MAIKWFGSLPRGHRAFKDTTLKITFTKKPRGIRLNSAFARALFEKQVDYVKLGVDDDRNVYVVMPSTAEEGLKIVKQGGGSAGQISSSTTYVWASQHNLIGQNVAGILNEESGMYEFDLTELYEQLRDKDSTEGE